MARPTNRIRNRASTRSISTTSVQAEMRDLVEFKFPKEINSQFKTWLMAPNEVLEQACSEVNELACSYLTWKQTPRSSREIIKAQLLEIARMDSHAQIQAIIEVLDKDTETHLWNALRLAPGWKQEQSPFHWLRDEPDMELVRSAATDAAAAMRGGDYSDIDLAAAVAGLVDIFERYAPKTMPKGTLAKRESYASRLQKSAKCFFKQVDPSVKEESVLNALDRERRARKKAASK